MTTMTDSKAADVLAELERDGDAGLKDRERLALERAIARLREPAGVGILRRTEAALSRHFDNTCDGSEIKVALEAKAFLAQQSAAIPQPPAEAQAQGGGEVVERVAIAIHRAYNSMLDDPDFPEGWPGWQGATPEEREFFLKHARDAVTAPPSAPVGVEGMVEAFEEYHRADHRDPAVAPEWEWWQAAWKAALAQQPAAIPRLANCGKYTATDNNGQHYYLNHANTWQTFQGQQPAAVDGAMATEGKKHDGPCWRNSHADCGC